MVAGRPRIFSTSWVTSAGWSTVSASIAMYASANSAPKPDADEALPHHVRRDFDDSAAGGRSTVADDLDQLGVGERLRTGQRDPLPDKVIGQQRARRDRGDVGLDDRRGGRRGIRSADDVAGPDLRRPHAGEVRREHRGPQAHPLQAGVDGELLDLLVAVAAEPGRLPGEVVVGVDRRQRDQFGDSGALAPRHHVGQVVAERPGVQEHRRRAGQRVERRTRTTSTPAGSRLSRGERVTARTWAPAATSSATSGRPTLPVAPVTTMVMVALLRVRVSVHARTGRRGEKLRSRPVTFARPDRRDCMTIAVSERPDHRGLATAPPLPGESRLPDAR